MQTKQTSHFLYENCTGWDALERLSHRLDIEYPSLRSPCVELLIPREVLRGHDGTCRKWDLVESPYIVGIITPKTGDSCPFSWLMRQGMGLTTYYKYDMLIFSEVES